jgi:hypothetical protein
MPSISAAITPTTCRMPRAGLLWKQSKLAAEANCQPILASEYGTGISDDRAAPKRPLCSPFSSGVELNSAPARPHAKPTGGVVALELDSAGSHCPRDAFEGLSALVRLACQAAQAVFIG